AGLSPAAAWSAPGGPATPAPGRPPPAAEAAARRERETAGLHKRLRKIDAAETAHAREIEHLASLPQDAPALTALRTRIIERFSDLETEAPRSATGSPPWPEPAPPATTCHCWTPCLRWATSSPMPQPASRPACSPHSAWS